MTTVESVSEVDVSELGPIYHPPRPTGVSGLYVERGPSSRTSVSELRIDVDNFSPQKVASGTLRTPRQAPWTKPTEVNWVANVTRGKAVDEWFGTIIDIDVHPTAIVPKFDQVRIQVMDDLAGRHAVLTLIRGRQEIAHAEYDYVAPSFRAVEMEFDIADGSIAASTYDTHAHSNRPSGLRRETLSMETVFRRAGFAVTKSGGDGVVPMRLAGDDRMWSNSEMHDAMQVHWQRYAERPQWSVWVLFASLHEDGQRLGGIMFDSMGRQRQGTAIFLDSFIANLPAGDPEADAWVQRMRFWTACHETGHAFNLYHSWIKSNATWGAPMWPDIVDEAEARSFMNYPYAVSGGAQAFFANFEHRFSDKELRFLRHAPSRFVQMGNAAFGDHHGFEERLAQTDGGGLRLSLRVNRDRPVFRFLEPVVLELKLENRSDMPAVVSEAVLAPSHEMAVIVRRDDGPVRIWRPYAAACHGPAKVEIRPGQAIYDSLFAAAGTDGWRMAEPGRYSIQVVIEVGGQSVVSNLLNIRIANPASFEEDVLAQDFFSDHVGRVLAMDGSLLLDKANDTLRDIRDRMGTHPVAVHADVALAMPRTRRFKVLSGNGGAPAVRMVAPDPAEPSRLMRHHFSGPATAVAETLGHVDFRDYAVRLGGWAAQAEGADSGRAVVTTARDALKARNVLPKVVERMTAMAEGFGKP